MQKTRIMFGTYNHIPEGSEESAFESAYQVSWRPFLSVLYRFPELPAVLHYSGTVFRWLEARHPEFLMLLGEMSSRKQIELLGGAFFAPLLPLIPGPDRLGQTEMLTTFLRRSFGKRPRGFWIQDYAWEPSIPSVLRTCGFDYTFLPRSHFRHAGITVSATSGPVMTEDQGRCVAVYPVFDAREDLPRLMPVETAFEWILDAEGELPVVSLMYDGDCMPQLWNDSSLESPDVLYERTFAAMQRNSLVYEATTPSRHFKSMRRFGTAYFPGSASTALRNASEGPVRQDAGPECGTETAPCRPVNTKRILSISPGSGNLYAKMQYVRILVGQMRGDKSRKKTAQEELWRGQCGAAYWPGREGGAANPLIVSGAYSALLEAERTSYHHDGDDGGIIRADLDFDGEKEILYQGGDTNTYIRLTGGVVFELDSLASRTNYVCASADPVRGESGCCIDRIYGSPEGTVDLGTFASIPYTLLDAARSAGSIVLVRDGWWHSGERRSALSIQKTYTFSRSGFSLDYELCNPENTAVEFQFSSEFNLSPGADPAGLEILCGNVRKGTPLSAFEDGTSERCTCLSIFNATTSETFVLRADSPFTLRHHPVLFGRTSFQGDPLRPLCKGFVFHPTWPVRLAAGATARLSITVEIQPS